MRTTAFLKRGNRTILILIVVIAPLVCVAFPGYGYAPIAHHPAPALTPTATPQPTVTPYPPVGWLETSDDAARLVWFYKPPEEENGLEQVAEDFDAFILTKVDEPERDELRSMGEYPPILQYLLFNSIQDPGGCDVQPFRNQVADQIGDFCRISVEHPDWFLLDEDGRRISDGRNVWMDPGNPEWRAFWLERARRSQERLGWYGVFLDNVEAGLAEFNAAGHHPARYPDDASYQAAVESFLGYLSTNYFLPQRRPMVANIISLADEAVWFRYLRYLDGAMEEAFAVDWRTGYLKPDTWEQEMRRMERSQAMGKSLVLVAQGERQDLERQQFAYASYLLINNGTAAFRYNHHSSYNQIWWYDNYGLDLGAALGERYRQGDLWRRDFARGFVTVDPVERTASITAK